MKWLRLQNPGRRGGWMNSQLVFNPRKWALLLYISAERTYHRGWSDDYWTYVISFLCFELYIERSI